MLMTKTAFALVVCAAFAGGILAHAMLRPTTVHAAGNRVYEIRTYTTPPGKLEALKTRFRDHTIRIFNKYDMKSVGYWVPQDAPLKDNTLIYVLSHASEEAAKKSWDGFINDPEWKAARDASEKDGKIVDKVEKVFMTLTDYSPQPK